MRDAVYGPSYDEFRDIIATYLDNPNQSPNPNTKVVELYYKPIAISGAPGYYFHTWLGLDGLGGAIGMEEDQDGWWKLTIPSAPDEFRGVFRDRNDPDDWEWQDDSANWDGAGRDYLSQADVVYVLGEDSTIYTSKP